MQLQFGLRKYEELMSELGRNNREDLLSHHKNQFSQSSLAAATNFRKELLENSAKPWPSLLPWTMIKRPEEKEDCSEQGMFRQDKKSFCYDRNRKEQTLETQERGLLEKELRERGLLGNEIRRRSVESDHLRLKNRSPDGDDSFEEATRRELELKDEIEFYRQRQGTFLPSSDYLRGFKDREFRDVRDIREMIELRRNQGLNSPSEEGSSTHLSSSPPLSRPAQYSPDEDWYSPTAPLGTQIGGVQVPSGSPKAERIFQVSSSVIDLLKYLFYSG